MNPNNKRVCQVCGSPISVDAAFCPVCAFHSALAADIQPTDVIPTVSAAMGFGHYEVLTHEDGAPFELGRGAMGVTYKAFDVDLRRLAALKVINPKYLTDESVRLRFVREARAAASVSHPNVASVFHLGTAGDDHFYAMEFVEGETLARLIKRSGRLQPKLALEIVRQVAAGLGAVHQANLVHRDIKPSNLMVKLGSDSAPSVKIIDLGLAKTLTESNSQTAISMAGAFVGTPEFASPEQISGVDVDIRSDLYSLGITLWVMLAGQPPFRGSPQEVMYQHRSAPLPLEKLQDVPSQVVALIEVLLRKDPARRFQTPTELLQALTTVREALDSGLNILKTIRVLISASGDVQKERNLADRLLRSAAAELDLPVARTNAACQRLVEQEIVTHDSAAAAEIENEARLILCPHFWEYDRLPSQSSSDQIPDPAQYDLVITIIWSRLGTAFAFDTRLPNGAPAGSGTEFAVAWALDHCGKMGALPQLRIYRNCANPVPPLEPKEAREAFGRDWDAVQEFFGRLEKDENAAASSRFNRYVHLEEFEELFRQHIREFLNFELGWEPGARTAVRKVRRWKSSPFRGLNVFDFEHSPIFCGRTRAIGEVIDALTEQRRARRPFVLLVGASGSGKSSLVRAGVLPLLTQPGTIEGIGLWRRAVTRPGAGGSGGDCFVALAAALLEPTALPTMADPESENPIRELATELRDNPQAAASRVRDALDHAAREWKIQRTLQLRSRREKSQESRTLGHTVLTQEPQPEPGLPRARLALVVDQFEELFTSGFSTELRQKYVAAIAGLVRSQRVLTLAALRSDFYPSYQEFPELIELTRPSGKVDLRPPTAYEIGNMIRLPAEAAGLSFERDRQTGQRLNEALRDAASTTPESLPLLEHVLSLLYEKQAERLDDTLRWSDYRDLGELKGALAQYAETAFSTLQPEEQGAFPLVMRHLVALGQGEEEVPNRRAVPYRDFVTADARPSAAKGFIDRFITKRLLVADTDPQGEVSVSVAHEALLREWQRIREWLAENREFLRMRDRLDFSMKLWLSRGKQKDDLLGPGLPLAEGEKLRKDFGSSLSQAQLHYVDASIAEHRRRQRAKEWIRYAVMAGITGALIIAIIFGVVSYRQYRRAEKSKVVLDQAVKNATLARDEAQKLINFMTVDLRDKLKPIGRLDLLNDVNQRVLDYYKERGAFGVSPEVRRQRSVALVNFGDVLLDQGSPAEALTLYQTALNVRRKLVQSEPNNPLYQADLALNLQQIGNVLELRGDVSKALENYDEALDIRKKLTSLSPQNLEWQSQLARSLEKVGLIQQVKGDLTSALKSFRESLKIVTKLNQEKPQSVPLESETWLMNIRVGEALDATKDPGDALTYYYKSLSIAQELKAQDPGNTAWQRDIGMSQEKIGDILYSNGDLTQSLMSYKKCFDERQKLFSQDSTNALWENDLALSEEDLANILSTEGDLAGSLKMYQECLSHRKALAGIDETNSEAQRDLEISAAEIGSVLLARGDLAEAWASYAVALQIASQLADKDPNNMEWQSNLAEVSEGMGDVLKAEGNFFYALQMYLNAMSVRTSLIAPDARWQINMAKNEWEIADILVSAKEYQQAIEFSRSAVKRIEPLLAREHDDAEVISDLATAYEKLGESLVRQSRPEEALPNLRNSLALFDRLTNRYPNHADWDSRMAFACFQIAEALLVSPTTSQLEIRTNLMRARDIWLRKKLRFALGPVDETHLNQVENVLRDVEGR